MILEIVWDIRSFFIVFSIGVLAVANFYYILDFGNETSTMGFNDKTYFNSVLYTFF